MTTPWLAHCWSGSATNALYLSRYTREISRFSPAGARATGISIAILSAIAVSGCTNDVPEPDTQPVIAGLRAAANSACVSLEVEGTSFCWGANEFGQVGNGLTLDQLRPAQVLDAPAFSTPFPGDHACASGESGLYCWGRNSSGEVGNATTDPVAKPALVSGGLSFQQVGMLRDRRTLIGIPIGGGLILYAILRERALSGD